MVPIWWDFLHQHHHCIVISPPTVILNLICDVSSTPPREHGKIKRERELDGLMEIWLHVDELNALCRCTQILYPCLFYCLLQFPVKRIVDAMECAMKKGNASVYQDGVVTSVTYWPVTLDVKNTDNAKMELASALWDGMDVTVHSVRIN